MDFIENKLYFLKQYDNKKLGHHHSVSYSLRCFAPTIYTTVPRFVVFLSGGLVPLESFSPSMSGMLVDSVVYVDLSPLVFLICVV